MEEKECWLIHPASAHLVVGHFSTVPHYISTTVYFVKNGIILTCVFIYFQMPLLVTRDFSALSSESWTPNGFLAILQSCFSSSVLSVCFLHTALFQLAFSPVLDLPVHREVQQLYVWTTTDWVYISIYLPINVQTRYIHIYTHIYLYSCIHMCIHAYQQASILQPYTCMKHDTIFVCSKWPHTNP